MRCKSTDSAFKRDMLERHVPEEVLAVLLKNRSTGCNLIWWKRRRGHHLHDEI